MPSELLKKTRRVNKIIQSSGSDPVRFSDLAEVLSEVLSSDVYLNSRKGRILGYSLVSYGEIEDWKKDIINEKQFPEDYNNFLLRINETMANINLENMNYQLGTTQENGTKKFATIVPISCGGDRLGTLIFERKANAFTEEDLVLAEYSATVAGMEIIRAKTDEVEEEARQKAVVQMAVGSLSYSEMEAIEHIFNELEGKEGLLVASKIADRVGITRSVIVNALRKLESAGVIESRSLGMKGTYIRILNDKVLDELKKAK